MPFDCAPTETEISALEALIRRLRNTPKMQLNEARRRGDAFREAVIKQMFDKNQSYGVASGGLAHLNIPHY